MNSDLSSRLLKRIGNTAEELKRNDILLGHYTSAENAFKMLESGEFWLRNARLMNDFDEIGYGIRLIHEANREGLLDPLRSYAEEVFKGSFEEAYSRFERECMARVYHHTFIGSLCEVKSQEIDGSPEMWRAYAQQDGVLMKIRPTAAFASDESEPDVYLWKMWYEGKKDIREDLKVLERRNTIIPPRSFNSVVNIIVDYFMHVIRIQKHPFFRSEHEWRIHSDFNPARAEPKCLAGVPQVVHTLRLDGTDIEGTTWSEILVEIVVGPSRLQFEIAKGLNFLLDREKGASPVPNVRCGNFPLRV